MQNTQMMDNMEYGSTFEWTYRHNKVKVEIQGKKYNINKLVDSEGVLSYKNDKRFCKINIKTETFMNDLVNQSNDSWFLLKPKYRIKLTQKCISLKESRLFSFLKSIEENSGICLDAKIGKIYSTHQILKCLELTKYELLRNGSYFFISISILESLKKLSDSLATNALVNINRNYVSEKSVYITHYELIENIELIYLSNLSIDERLKSIDLAIEGFKLIQKLRDLNLQNNGCAIGLLIKNEYTRETRTPWRLRDKNWKLKQESLNQINKLLRIIFYKKDGYVFLLGKYDPNSVLSQVLKEIIKYIFILGLNVLRK